MHISPLASYTYTTYPKEKSRTVLTSGRMKEKKNYVDVTSWLRARSHAAFSRRFRLMFKAPINYCFCARSLNNVFVLPHGHSSSAADLLMVALPSGRRWMHVAALSVAEGTNGAYCCWCVETPPARTAKCTGSFFFQSHSSLDAWRWRRAEAPWSTNVGSHISGNIWARTFMEALPADVERFLIAFKKRCSTCLINESQGNYSRVWRTS